MRKLTFYLTMFGVVLASTWTSQHISYAQDFYAGKTIRIVVGFPAGGGFDTYSRIIARHISKYIPGNPTVVVDNVTGAGSLIAANSVYKAAKPDGLTIGNFIGNLISQSTGTRTRRKRSGPGRWNNRLGWTGWWPTRHRPICPCLEGLGPWFLRKANCPDTYELLSNSVWNA